MKQVTKGQWNGYDTYILHSRELEFTLLPRLGNHVISLWDRKKEREVIRRPERSEYDYDSQEPCHFGIPLLISPGQNLHHCNPWCVSDIEEDEDGCAVTTEFHTADDARWMEQFPAPLALETTFRLQDTRLTLTLKVTNTGNYMVPFGIGYHSWFMLDGEPERWHLILPAGEAYGLNDEMLPSGKPVPWESLRISTGQPAEAILMRSDGYGLRYSTGSGVFRHWGLYSKDPAGQSICLMPHTWPPNLPNVPANSELTGLPAVNPGQSLIFTTAIEMIYPQEDVQ